MKLQINAQKFLQEINVVGGCIKPTSPMPILDTVNVKSENGQLKFICDNLEIRSEITSEAIPSEDFSFCVDYDLLRRMLQGLPDAPVTIETDEKTFYLKSDVIDYELPLIPSNEFPENKAIGFDEKIEINSAEFFNAIKKAVVFVSDDDISKVMGSVMCSIANDIKIVGLATHNFYEETLTTKSENEPIELLMSKEICKYIVNLSMEKEYEGFNLYYNDSHVLIETEDLKISAIQSAGKFPDYAKILDNLHSDHTFEMDSEQLKQTVSRFNNLTVDKYKTLKLTIDANNINFYFNNTALRYKGDESILINYNGPKTILGVNCRFLLNIINCFDGQVTCMFTGEKTPCLFTDSTKRILLAPVMLD